MELGRLLGSFLLIFLAEMGDKSQFLMVAMTSEFRVRDILCGVGGAVLILNLLAVTLGAAVGEWIPLSFVSIVAGVAFLTFAYLGLEDSEETYTGRRTGRAAWIGVLGTYFLAELGDKTQLTVLTLSAETGAHSIWEPITVLIASSIGLFAADAIGLAVGFVLGKRMPRTAFAALSFLLFFACGVLRLLEGAEALLEHSAHPTLFAVVITVALALTFFALCGLKIRKRNTKKGGVTHGGQNTGRAKSVRV